MINKDKLVEQLSDVISSRLDCDFCIKSGCRELCRKTGTSKTCKETVKIFLKESLNSRADIIKINITVTICCTVLFGLIAILGIQQKLLKNKIAYTEKALTQLSEHVEEEMKGTEEKCMRITDQCIDILSNQRW